MRDGERASLCFVATALSQVVTLRHVKAPVEDVTFIMVLKVETWPWDENLALRIVRLALRAQWCCLALRAERFAPGLRFAQVFGMPHGARELSSFFRELLGSLQQFALQSLRGLQLISALLVPSLVQPFVQRTGRWVEPGCARTRPGGP